MSGYSLRNCKVCTIMTQFSWRLWARNSSSLIFIVIQFFVLMCVSHLQNPPSHSLIDYMSLLSDIHYTP
ncbi:uncharacterized protein BO66DRAFT_31481 [Aspergillus aculeatinus CBS 121060]|uniref:Uncharacterized protein n=1 Tax=Aspergillus aculeatinus CBS 121060 TaxID=1448322 RepID=A0ACD1HFB2_9EURO|nr:hypothetical protein BO66DRAFT_31481 [Aspergillus aculeatinus CBS 121060]RAH72316.1 hypothetical protein BO66DRAFT_31481 [Aspergillus aculeatinus CBS 121060]